MEKFRGRVGATRLVAVMTTPAIIGQKNLETSPFGNRESLGVLQCLASLGRSCFAMELPHELLMLIIQHLPPSDLVRLLHLFVRLTLVAACVVLCKSGIPTNSARGRFSLQLLSLTWPFKEQVWLRSAQKYGSSYLAEWQTQLRSSQ
jgi:hypothetical protein